MHTLGDQKRVFVYAGTITPGRNGSHSLIYRIMADIILQFIATPNDNDCQLDCPPCNKKMHMACMWR
jgi:hypothetical protein